MAVYSVYKQVLWCNAEIWTQTQVVVSWEMLTPLLKQSQTGVILPRSTQILHTACLVYSPLGWFTIHKKTELHYSTVTHTHTQHCNQHWLPSHALQPHMTIGYMHNSLNHSLPLTVCMALTFILCRKSAPKVSHSSCTRPLWPKRAAARTAVTPSWGRGCKSGLRPTLLRKARSIATDITWAGRSIQWKYTIS